MARTQALFHFLARGVAETGIRVGRLSTPGPTKLFDDFRDVQNDSLQLFQDLHRLNRFAPTVRKQLIECLRRLDEELSVPKRTIELPKGRSPEKGARRPGSSS